MNQADIEQLHAGARARVHVDSLPSVEIPGRLVAVGITSSPSRYRPSYVSSVPVRIQLENVAPLVLPNVSASADIIVASQQAKAIIPRECVFEGRTFVREGDAWKPVPVELGLASLTEVAVRNGLDPGQEIACEIPSVALP